MEYFKIVVSFCFSILFCYVIIELSSRVYNYFFKKGGIIPNIRNIPPAPFQRYNQPRPTIETQYGRDLMRISAEIYIFKDEMPEDVSDIAETIISKVNEKCFEIDLQNQEERNKKEEEMIAESLRQLSKTGIK